MIFLPLTIMLMIFTFIVGFGVGNVWDDWYIENRPSSYRETKNFVDAYDTGKLKKTFKMRRFRHSVKNDFGYQLWLLYQLYPYYRDNDNEDIKEKVLSTIREYEKQFDHVEQYKITNAIAELYEIIRAALT